VPATLPHPAPIHPTDCIVDHHGAAAHTIGARIIGTRWIDAALALSLGGVQHSKAFDGRVASLAQIFLVRSWIWRRPPFSVTHTSCTAPAIPERRLLCNPRPS
jgi:hypothetical protein